MASLADIMVSKFHRNDLSFFEGILDKCIVLLEVEYDTLSHIDEFGYDLLGVLIDVALFFDFLTRFLREKVIDAVTIDHVHGHLDK